MTFSNEWTEEIEMKTDKLMDCVNAFANEMKSKLRKKRAAGYEGWNEPFHKRQIIRMLKEHVGRTDISKEGVDIANLAMFLWNFKLMEDFGKAEDIDHDQRSL